MVWGASGQFRNFSRSMVVTTSVIFSNHDLALPSANGHHEIIIINLRWCAAISQ
jgi:hypothetical protein